MSDPVVSSPAKSRGLFATQPGVRPEIQALRTIAVMAVVLYHLWPLKLPGGYIGVDIFFVISGFLITAHLVREVDRTGRIRLTEFWARRARRLLPASLLVIVASIVGTFIWAPQSLWQQYFQEFGASALYVLNWALAANSVDYLAAENSPSPVQHYWSLSAEEQFYIVWPLLVLLAVVVVTRVTKLSRRAALTITLGVVVVASLAFSIYLTAYDPSPAYFVTPTRAWEFGVGGLLAIALGAKSSSTEPNSSIVRALASWLGLAGLAITLLRFTDTTPFPGYLALLPVLSTALVIWAGTSTHWWSPTYLARFRPVQWVGDNSYSIYLWHWPLVVLVPFVLDRELGAKEKLVILAASLLLGWLTKLLVEDPARTATFLTAHRPRRTLLLTAAAMVVVIGVSAGSWVTLQQRFDASLTLTESLTGGTTDCFGAAAFAPGAPDPCINPKLEGVLLPDRAVGQGDAVLPKGRNCRAFASSTQLLTCDLTKGTFDGLKVALVGDSHAEHWVPAMTIVAKQRGWQLTTFLKGGCGFSTVMRDDDATRAKGSCGPWNDRVLDALDEGDFDLIVTSQASGKTFDKLPGETDVEASARGLVEQWAIAEERTGGQVIAIRDNPLMPFNVPECLSGLGDEVTERISECARPQSEALFDDAQVLAGEQTGTGVVDLTQYFCKDEECPSVIGSVIVYRDQGHLGGTYSRTLGPYLGEEIDALLR